MTRLARGMATLSPWSPVETARAASLLVVGALTALVAWWGASREESLGEQVRWANAAVLGTVIAGYGLSSWVLRGHWAVRRRRAALLPDVAVVAADPRPVEQSAFVVAGAGLRRFHRDSCPLASGRGWGSTPRDAAIAQGRLPCGVCRP